MNYLLDTHLILWLAENSTKLSDIAKAIILNETNKLHVSVASCWEVSIKLSLGKLDIVGGTNEFFRILESNGFSILDITEEQLCVLESLPYHHRDPFDRLLVATAIADDLTLLTDDKQLLAYAGNALKIVL